MPKKLASSVTTKIDELLDKGRTTTEILEDLGDDAPDEKTIRRRKKRRESDDPRATWSLGHASASEAASVPRIIAAVIERTEGRVTTVSNQEARLAANIASAAPDLEAFEVYRLARDYVAASRDKVADLARGLDLYLAFAPWRSDEARDRYLRGMESGWYPALGVSVNEIIARQTARVADLAKEIRNAKKSTR